MRLWYSQLIILSISFKLCIHKIFTRDSIRNFRELFCKKSFLLFCFFPNWLKLHGWFLPSKTTRSENYLCQNKKKSHREKGWSGDLQNPSEANMAGMVLLALSFWHGKCCGWLTGGVVQWHWLESSYYCKWWDLHNRLVRLVGVVRPMAVTGWLWSSDRSHNNFRPPGRESPLSTGPISLLSHMTMPKSTLAEAHRAQ